VQQLVYLQKVKRVFYIVCGVDGCEDAPQWCAPEGDCTTVGQRSTMAHRMTGAASPERLTCSCSNLC